MVGFKSAGRFFLFMALVAGCRLFHDTGALKPPDQLPQTFTLYESRPTPDHPWWESFGSRELNHLIHMALAQNLTLKQVLARLDQARARAVIEGAARYPDLTAAAGTTLGRRWIRDETNDRGEEIENYNLGLVSSYELDLWGRVRAEQSAAQLTARAALADADTAAMTIAAEVTERWLNIITAKNRLERLHAQIGTNDIRLELVALRFQKGLTTALDVYQQRELVARTQRELPLTEAEIETQRYQLALLLGLPPHMAPKIKADNFPDYPKIPAVGLPADLLAHRPDVHGAGLRLQASRRNLEAARANRLPAIRLTGSVQYNANLLDFLFQNWLYRLAASLTAPLVDAGRLKAAAQVAKGELTEQLAAYEATVYQAVLEVETALIREAKRQTALEHLTRQLNNARKGLEQAMRRYRNGLSDYLPVLAQLISVQESELSLINGKAELIRNRIALYRALGGGWGANLAQREYQ